MIGKEYRWVILVLVCILESQPALSQANLFSLQSQLSTLYDMSQETVVLLMMCTPLITCIATFPCNWLLCRISVSQAILLAQILLLIGNLLRTAINYSSSLLILGQIVVAISNCLYTQIVPKISARWFPPQERIMSTTLMTSIYLVGNSIGFYLNGIYITDGPSQPQKIQSLFQVVAFSSLVLLIIELVLMREHPAVAVSNLSSRPSRPFSQDLRDLSSNRDFLLLLVYFSIELGIYIAVSTFFIKIVTTYDPKIPLSQANHLGSSLFLMTTLAKIIVGLLFHHSFGFKKVLALSSSLKYSTLLLFLVALSYDTAVTFFLVIFSLCLTLFFAIGVEFSCEVSFPAAEVSCNGIMIAAGCIYSFLTGHVVNSIVADPILFPLFLIANFAVAMFSLLKIDEVLHRLNQETNQDISINFDP